MFTITIQRAPIAVAFEVGSISEAIGILEQEDTNLRRVVGIADTLSGTVGEAPATEGATAETTKGKRGRPAKDKNQPDPATAQAPAPLPVPPAPELAAQNAAAAATGEIPEYLRRPAAETAAPPPPPPPPPAPPAAPPSGILAGKVIGALDARATTDDAKATLAKWLADYRLVNPGSSYDESIAAVRLMPDDKLAQVATALQVA